MQDRVAETLDRLSLHLERTRVQGALNAWPAGLTALARVLERIPQGRSAETDAIGREGSSEDRNG